MSYGVGNTKGQPCPYGAKEPHRAAQSCSRVHLLCACGSRCGSASSVLLQRFSRALTEGYVSFLEVSLRCHCSRRRLFTETPASNPPDGFAGRAPVIQVRALTPAGPRTEDSGGRGQATGTAAGALRRVVLATGSLSGRFTFLQRKSG